MNANPNSPLPEASNSRLNADMNAHLNEDQFAECAFGDGSIPPELAGHLAACDSCRAEVVAFQESVQNFNQVSLAWSELQEAQSLRPLVRKRETQPAWAIASWALAGCLALASAVSIGTHRQSREPADVARNTAEAQDSAAQIERDNKLLMAMDQATSTRVASPLLEYGLDSSAAARERTAPPMERE